jgi:hypothetical protein
MSDIAANTEPFVGVRAAARALEVNPSTISRQLKDGILRNHGTAAEPKLLVSEVRADRERHLDRSKQRGPDAPLFNRSGAIEPEAAEPEAEGEGAPAGGVDYQKARTAREGFQARIAQIDLEERLGNLLDRGEVVDAFFALGQLLRESMEGRRAGLAARLVGISDPSRIGSILAEADGALLLGLAKDFERFTEESKNAA